MKQTETIEKYLFGRMTRQEKILFDHRLIVDDELRESCESQRVVYDVVKEFGRQKIKRELDLIHQELMSSPRYTTFKTLIKYIFTL